MTEHARQRRFADAPLFGVLEAADHAALDRLRSGVIRMDRAGAVIAYREFESFLAGLGPSRVLGPHFSSVVACCTKNVMIGTRFEEVETLDSTIDDVFKLRMRATPVRRRLLKMVGHQHLHLRVNRHRG